MYHHHLDLILVLYNRAILLLYALTQPIHSRLLLFMAGHRVSACTYVHTTHLLAASADLTMDKLVTTFEGLRTWEYASVYIRSDSGVPYSSP